MDVRTPPIMATPIDWRCEPKAVIPMAIGKVPAINAREVIKIGRSLVLQASMNNLITGTILALSRAAGETAPLLFTAFGSMYLSYSLKEPMASLPVQIYTYAISPFKEWHQLAWSGALVLMVLVLGLNLFSRLVIAKLKK